jgi:UDP-N-acetylglucosamine 2-epimerase (non-hydrolysing)
MKIIHVIGARPNFMKAAPAIAALQRVPAFHQKIVHTGQHYDANMSEVFFEQLGLPPPDFNLGVGSGSHAVQTAQIMVKLEQVLAAENPRMVLVYGDVNSTLAAALVCSKVGIRFAHIEAGLRSHDRTMPEEINRVVTDRLADLLFTPSRDANENLLREGIPADRIHFVGNLMIDTLIRQLPFARLPKLPGVAGRYVLVTLHRPSNVDHAASMREILETLASISQDIAVVFPVHPRTRERLLSLGPLPAHIHCTEPLGYREFLALQQHATAVLTDSGGVQEETTYLGVPCFTLRENTERPVTIQIGTNTLVGRDGRALQALLRQIHLGKARRGAIPERWDGKAGERLANVLTNSVQ